MKKCPRCEKSVSEVDKFCGYCGMSLSATDYATSFTQNELKLSDIRLKLGMVYLKQGNLELARENFEKVLSLEPENRVAKEILKQIEQQLLDEK